MCTHAHMHTCTHARTHTHTRMFLHCACFGIVRDQCVYPTLNAWMQTCIKQCLDHTSTCINQCLDHALVHACIGSSTCLVRRGRQATAAAAAGTARARAAQWWTPSGRTPSGAVHRPLLRRAGRRRRQTRMQGRPRRLAIMYMTQAKARRLC